MRGARLPIAVDVEGLGVGPVLLHEVRHAGTDVDHLVFINLMAFEHEILVAVRSCATAIG